MMRKSLLLLAASALACLGLQAQTMKVWQGQVATAIPAATAADMLFSADGAQLTVLGNTFDTQNISRITVDRSTVAAHALTVNYAEGAATVVVTADIAPQLAINVQGAHVSVLAAPTVNQEVNYTLTGTSANGSFWMDGEYKATLTLDNLNLTNPDSAAIDVENGKRIRVVLPAGTTTQLADASTALHDACFFINGHAEFEGGGALLLTGNGTHAYASDEYTTFGPDFGQFTVLKAANDGLHIKQYLKVQGGTFRIAGTQGDCIDVGATKDPTDEFNGQAIIEGGSLALEVGADDTKGLKSDSAMVISGGQIDAQVTGLGTKGISTGTDLTIQGTSGNPSITMNVTGTTYMKGDPTLESKCRGIKVKGNFTFNGGTINMTVTGEKAKGISVDGEYIYQAGETNVLPS